MLEDLMRNTLKTCRIVIGHLDTRPTPKLLDCGGLIKDAIVYDRNGNIEKKAPISDPNSHSSISTKIIFDDSYYSLPTISKEIKLLAVSIPNRGKTLLNVLKGMDWLLEKKPQIVCMPIGFRKQTPIFYPMIRAFIQNNILPIVPIGNTKIGTAFVPGCYPEVLSVGALDSQGQVAPYSGSYLDEKGQCLKPELMALGNYTLSGMRPKNGTSFACSYVTGVVARLLQVNPIMSVMEIKQALFSTTQPLPKEQNQHCSKGTVQPTAALAYLKELKASSKLPADFIPDFLRQPYRDSRFMTKYKYANPEQLLEAILIPTTSQTKQEKEQETAPLSRQLISVTQKKSGLSPADSHYFTHADMVYISAKPAFYEALLTHPDLFAISAVDVSIFEM